MFKRRPRPSSVFLFSSAVIQFNLYSWLCFSYIRNINFQTKMQNLDVTFSRRSIFSNKWIYVFPPFFAILKHSSSVMYQILFRELAIFMLVNMKILFLDIFVLTSTKVRKKAFLDNFGTIKGGGAIFSTVAYCPPLPEAKSYPKLSFRSEYCRDLQYSDRINSGF